MHWSSRNIWRSNTPGWEGIFKHGVYHTAKNLGVDESVMWGEYFFVEALDESGDLLRVEYAICQTHESKICYVVDSMCSWLHNSQWKSHVIQLERPHRSVDDRRRAADRRAEHDGDAHAGHRRHGRAGQRICTRPGRMWCGSPSIARRTPRRWPRFAGRRRANLSVDLQENYRLAELVAPHVDKVRYNPGHLYHHEREKPWQEKVRYLADVAARQRLCDARGRELRQRRSRQSGEATSRAIRSRPMLESAWEHCELLDSLGFTRYCVSLKDSDPQKVIEVNRRFAERRPDVPLHLGVTEAGLPPDGIIKTRIAFEQLISRGIGDTIRVSLTVPNSRKPEEIAAGRQILADIAAGRVRSVVDYGLHTLNIIQLPELFARRERGVHRAGAAGQGDDALRQRARDHDRRDGLPRERPRRNGRRRPGAVVRADAREFETRSRIARRISLRRDPGPTQAENWIR